MPILARLHWSFVILAMLASSSASADEKAPAPPAVGDAARDFSLDTLDGKTVKLVELTKKGPVVLVVLRGWVGYQCPICTKQVGELISHKKDFQAAGANVVLVYPGPADKLKEHAADFVSGKGLPENVSFVLDPELKFVSAWGLRWDAPKETAYPSTFVIDAEGKVRFVKMSKTHGNRATSGEILNALKTKQ